MVAMVSVALKVPVVVGAQVTSSVALAPPSGMLSGKLGLLARRKWLAPAPLICGLLRVNVMLPVSLMVSVVVTLLPTWTLPRLIVLPGAGVEA